MKYIAKKFGSLLLTLLLVSFLSFFAFSVIPGDAAKSQLGTEATPERIEALQKEMGLDRPVLERYASWVTGFFHGDLGTSYSYSMPVGELIRDKVPITIAITVIAFLMILVVSIPIGIFTAQHAGGHLDRSYAHPGGRNPRSRCPFPAGPASPHRWFDTPLYRAFGTPGTDNRWTPPARCRPADKIPFYDPGSRRDPDALDVCPHPE